MEHTKHIWRISILLFLLLLILAFVRHFLVPESFGDMGYYRYDALAEIAEFHPSFGPRGACAECHDDVAAAKARGKHAVVQCEVCHAPLGTHVADGDVIAPMAVNRSYKLCASCHQVLVARPASQPQINLHEHLELSVDQAIPDEACLDCHDTESIHSP